MRLKVALYAFYDFILPFTSSLRACALEIWLNVVFFGDDKFSLKWRGVVVDDDFCVADFLRFYRRADFKALRLVYGF